MNLVDLSHVMNPARRASSTAPAPGTVTLLGAGPGDPELLTVKAVKALQAAQLVLYDHLVSPAVLEPRFNARYGGAAVTPQLRNYPEAVAIRHRAIKQHEVDR